MNKKIIVFTIILSLIGLLSIYSSSYIWSLYKYGYSFKYLLNQSIFFIIGIVMMRVFSKIDYKIYKKYSNIFLGISFLLLVIVLIPGIGSVRNGSRSWFGIGPFGIQPSEAAKLGLIIFTSKYLNNSDKYLKDLKKGILPILGVTFLAFGLIMLQPDLGTGLVLMVSIIALLFIAGLDMKFFYGAFVLGVIGTCLLIAISPYRMNRITSFINPWKDPLGTGFQMIQSMYAIGPGGLLGQGFLNSRQKHFYLPEPQTDFIFSIVCEEFGVVGCIFVCTLFFLLFYFSLKISLNAKNLFAKYLSFGISFQMLFQASMNLAVVVGLIPVTGVTLPFLSYGGSSLLISMISIGILISIAKE